MSTNTLNNRASGQTILDTFFNDIHSALDGDFVGRGATGIPTAGQNLGTVALPWGPVHADSLVLGGSPVDTSQIVSPPNRVISGKKRATSNQPAFIAPNGAALSLQILGASTSLNLDINGVVSVVSTDITIGSLSPAPSSQNTATINDAAAAGQHDTRLWGEPEHRKTLTMTSAGTAITALVGKFAAFKLNSEYLWAFVKSSTELTNVRRGYFYDASINPVNRGVVNNSDTLTLLKTAWIFVQNDGSTTDVTYNTPTWSEIAPAGPVTGDYWYDSANQIWKRYDGAAFQIINRVLVGMAVNSSTACLAARCVDFYAKYDPKNEISLEKSTTEIVKANKIGSKVSVAGKDIDFRFTLPSWNITTDLAISSEMYNATEQNDRVYYLYVTDVGQNIISDISPYFREDLLGEYHPHNPWRCVGIFYNDGTGNIQAANSVNVKFAGTIHVDTANGYGGVTRRWTNSVLGSTDLVYVDDPTNGGQFTCAWPGVFSATYTDNFTSSSTLYISKNPTNFAAPGTGENLASDSSSGGNLNTNCAATVDMKIGDYFGLQTGGVAVGAGLAMANFRRAA